MMRFVLSGMLVASLSFAAHAGNGPTSDSLPALSILSMDLSGNWEFCRDASIGPAGATAETSPPVAAEKTKIPVPGSWERAGQVIPNPAWGTWEPYNGVAWYQRTVWVPPDWVGFDAQLNLGHIDDRGRVFWNGRVIGESESGNWDTRVRIPAAQLCAGSTSTLSVRVIDDGGPGGMAGPDVAMRVISPYDRITVSVDFSGVPGNATAPESVPDITGVMLRTGSPVRIRVSNATDFPLSGILTLDIRNEIGASVAVLRDQVGLIARASTSTVIFHLPTIQRGWYLGIAELSWSGHVAASGRRSFTCLGTQAGTAQRGPDSPFGINLSILSLPVSPAFQDAPTSGLDRLPATGTKWGRSAFWRSSVESTGSEERWAATDRIVQMYGQAGLEALATVCDFSPDSVSSNGQLQVPGFADYLEQVATRYRGKVRHWEIWNEPNRSEYWKTPDPRAYARLLAAACSTLKRIDRENKVVAFAAAGVDLQFIGNVIAAGATRDFDIVSVHAYQRQAPWETEDPADGKPTEFEKLRALRQLLDRHGRSDAHIWVTECGYQTSGPLPLLDQARMLVQSVSWLLADGLADHVFWSSLADSEGTQNRAQDRSGLCFSDGSPKPSLLAYRTLCEQLAGFTLARRAESAPGSDRFTFQTPRGSVELVWARNDSMEIPLRPGQRVVDVFGRAVEMSNSLLTIGKQPVYLVPTPGDGSTKAPRPGLR